MWRAIRQRIARDGDRRLALKYLELYQLHVDGRDLTDMPLEERRALGDITPARLDTGPVASSYPGRTSTC
jgi:ATP-dependent DNA ligase